MTTFVRAANPIWWLPDHTGVSLNDEYYAFFLTNTLPYIPQAVYQDPAGATQWSNPIEFSPAGTLPDNLYFDPTLVYRIEVRHGNTQADELIWEINDFVPGENGAGPVVEDQLTVAANLITNPQFADIDFESPLTFTTASPSTYTFDIGPGWQIIVTGTGTLTVTQHTNAGTSHITGNPPYYLDILTSGWTTATLRQKLENNGAIFSGGAIAVALTAAAVTSAKVLTVQYAPSTGTATNIFQKSIPTGALTPYQGYASYGDSLHDLPLSTNSDVGTAAYVNIDFLLPGTGELQLTNIQVVGQSDPLSTGFDTDTDLPAFRELTYEQVENGEFNVYKDELIYKPIPSFLVGWDFPLNPAQPLGDTVAAQSPGNNKSFYVWDQTIVFQSTDSGGNFSRDVSGGFTINAVASGQFAVIQYLDQVQARKLLNQPLSVHISALTSMHDIPVTVSLWYTSGSALPDLNSNLSIVATLDADGKPATFNNPTAGTWTELQTIDGQTLTETIQIESAVTQTGFHEYSFSGYNLDDFATANAVTFFAIVIGTAPMVNLDTMHINSVGLCQGKIPTRPAPQSADEVLRECQRFYEKSYVSNVVPGAVTPVGLNSVQQFIFNKVIGGGHTNYFYPLSFYQQWKQTKRVNPNVKLYSPSAGTIDRADTCVLSNGSLATAIDGANPTVTPSNGWSITATISTDGAMFIAQATTSSINGADNSGSVSSSSLGYEAVLEYHYTLDARLGII